MWTQVFMTEPQYLFVSTFSSLYLLHYSCLSILQQGIRASSILAALFHHHGCVDVVLNIFGGSLLVHLCLVVGVCYLYSGIKISLFHLSEILIPDLFWLLCILLIFGSIPSNSRASTHFWVDSQPNLFSLRYFSHLSCWWLLLLLLSS